MLFSISTLFTAWIKVYNVCVTTVSKRTVKSGVLFINVQYKLRYSILQPKQTELLK